MISFCEHEPNMPAVFDYFHETRTHRAGGRPGARGRVESDRANFKSRSRLFQNTVYGRTSGVFFLS